ncbi:hypothetical protein WKH71_05230 [Pantoea agglomerans]|uniref:hypothetical protein n=1 Tax=Enterobacter agglomerans TaxID=549 RepID=UPI003C7986B1
MALCDKRSIELTARSMDDLEKCLSSIPGWELQQGTTRDFEYSLRRENEHINFKVTNNTYDITAISVNIYPQDQSKAPSKLSDDVIYQVYNYIVNNTDQTEVGINLNVSELDIHKLAKS